MIKKIFSLIVIAALIVSCKSKSKEEKEASSRQAKKISKRDRSINASSAFNNIFFDSIDLVKFYETDKVADTLQRRITSFYNSRNYQFAWFSETALTEQARGFWNLHKYQSTYGKDTSLRNKLLEKMMDNYVAEDSIEVRATDKNILNTELMLTKHFILYSVNNIEKGYLKRKEMERFIPSKKVDPLLLTDSLLLKKHKDDKYYEDVNASYKSLKEQLRNYYNIVKQGGWPTVDITVRKMKKGISSPEIIKLKKRLQLSADMPLDTTDIFNDELTAGIKNFQFRFGYNTTGLLTDRQIADLNVPVQKRIKQLLINMGRMQWMINEPQGQMIVVNIPEFMLHVKDGKEKVFDMNVVVGKAGHNTMIFTGNLNQIVFSPYWNIPSSIVKKEILPEMNRNSNYLETHNMEIIGDRGGVPAIRQLPGADNALGKIKFLFPNSFDIYFHDTPAKSLFAKDRRAFSHGCIRLSDPVKMANYLLKDNKEWSAEKIDSAMNSNKEKYIRLKTPVPVLITYYTAWVDNNGQLHFADDIYGHDKMEESKMFIN